ncbi:MAG: DUF3737 family protein [Ruminococcaceae bacterium]|nr:DUF3737 family protein [Oscillospiraceae bacterium]
MKRIENKCFDEERALYASRNLTVVNCKFDGPADGESALKESRDVEVRDSYFNLRYPFWHVEGLTVSGCELTPLCRAALWYSKNAQITDCRLHGVKALRECENVSLKNCDAVSAELGWFCRGIEVTDCAAEGEYLFLRSRELRFNRLKMKGKYSFQYIRNAVFEDCLLDTKDAFWHAENVTVRNSVVKGEYLAWYSKGLTLENCRMIGTQPFCYCEDLRLINCEMIDTDLAFERSHVHAEVTTPVISIKNPYSGRITLPSAGEVILDDENALAEIVFSGKE